jgi:hypothetical protein
MRLRCFVSSISVIMWYTLGGAHLDICSDRMAYPAILSCWIARLAGNFVQDKLSRWSKRALETEFHVRQIVKDYDAHTVMSTPIPPTDDGADHVMDLLADDE